MLKLCILDVCWLISGAARSVVIIGRCGIAGSLGSSTSLPLPLAVFSSWSGMGYVGPDELTRGAFDIDMPYSEGTGSQRGFVSVCSISETATWYRAGFVGILRE